MSDIVYTTIKFKDSYLYVIGDFVEIDMVAGEYPNNLVNVNIVGVAKESSFEKAYELHPEYAKEFGFIDSDSKLYKVTKEFADKFVLDYFSVRLRNIIRSSGKSPRELFYNMSERYVKKLPNMSQKAYMEFKQVCSKYLGEFD